MWGSTGIGVIGGHAFTSSSHSHDSWFVSGDDGCVHRRADRAIRSSLQRTGNDEVLYIVSCVALARAVHCLSPQGDRT